MCPSRVHTLLVNAAKYRTLVTLLVCLFCRESPSSDQTGRFVSLAVKSLQSLALLVSPPALLLSSLWGCSCFSSYSSHSFALLGIMLFSSSLSPSFFVFFVYSLSLSLSGSLARIFSLFSLFMPWHPLHCSHPSTAIEGRAAGQ